MFYRHRGENEKPSYAEKVTMIADAGFDVADIHFCDSVRPRWNDALASDNALSSQEIENLVSREENLTQRMIAERDRLAAITGYDDSYSSSEAKGSINAAKSMSDDTANELVGRVTAVQLTEERLAAGQQQQFIAITQISGNISSVAAQMPEMRNIADETRTIIANSYLELQEIRENTGAIVQPIQKMQKDISEIKTKL